jgi:hypothetical protein
VPVTKTELKKGAAFEILAGVAPPRLPGRPGPGERNPEAGARFKRAIDATREKTAMLDAVMPSAVPNLLSLPRPSAEQVIAATAGAHSRMPGGMVTPSGASATDFDAIVPELCGPDGTYIHAKVIERFLALGGCFHMINKIAIDALPEDGVPAGAGAAGGSFVYERFLPPTYNVLYRKGHASFAPLQHYSVPKLALGPLDYVLPVCHEGKNRSQVLQALLSHGLGAARVADAHGVFGGLDPPPENVPASAMDDSDDRLYWFMGYTPDLEIETNWLWPGAATQPPFENYTGSVRRPKFGYREVALGVQSNADGAPPASPVPLVLAAQDAAGALFPVSQLRAEGPRAPSSLITPVVYDLFQAPGKAAEEARRFVHRSRVEARRWFTSHYYRPSVLRAKAPAGKVVFCAFMDSAATIITRLVEAATFFRERLDHIYVVNLLELDLISDVLVSKSADKHIHAVGGLASLFRFTSSKCCTFCGVDHGEHSAVAVCNACGAYRLCHDCGFADNVITATTCVACDARFPPSYLPAAAPSMTARTALALGGRSRRR